MLNRIDQIISQWRDMAKGKFQQSALMMLSYGILWGIWIARNKLIFKDKMPD
jgi:hypothetical protein